MTTKDDDNVQKWAKLLAMTDEERARHPEWAELLREDFEEMGDPRQMPWEELRRYLHAGIPIGNKKLKVICPTSIEAGKWFWDAYNWEEHINFALKFFVDACRGTKKQLVPPIIQGSPKLQPNEKYDWRKIMEEEDFPNPEEEAKQSEMDRAAWRFREDEAWTIVDVDFDVIDWLQRRYGMEYQDEIAKILTAYAEQMRSPET